MNRALEEALAASVQLGLEIRGDAAIGVFDGCPVTVGPPIDRRETSQAVTVRGHLGPALDLGLQLGKPDSNIVGASVVTGNADLDGELTITADEPKRARVLFEDGLADALATLYRRSSKSS